MFLNVMRGVEMEDEIRRKREDLRNMFTKEDLYRTETISTYLKTHGIEIKENQRKCNLHLH